MSFRLNFSSNTNLFAVYDIDRLSCDTFLTHSPCANAAGPNYSLNRFPCVGNVWFP